MILRILECNVIRYNTLHYVTALEIDTKTSCLVSNRKLLRVFCLQIVTFLMFWD